MAWLACEWALISGFIHGGAPVQTLAWALAADLVLVGGGALWLLRREFGWRSWKVVRIAALCTVAFRVALRAVGIDVPVLVAMLIARASLSLRRIAPGRRWMQIEEKLAGVLRGVAGTVAVSDPW